MIKEKLWYWIKNLLRNKRRCRRFCVTCEYYNMCRTESDVKEGNYREIEYKGYIIGQASNHHIWVIKDGITVLHAQHNKKNTEDELKGVIDALISMREKEVQGE